MKLGSLFDGSGGFPLAASLCGIEPVWAAEIEPYPIAVTRSRFPVMKHLGNVTGVHGGQIEPVDIISFGSPCQDLSIAGKRAGLKHEGNGDEETTRSGLFMEAVRIIKEMREATNGEYPKYAIWENVPGAFSSNKGEDFRIVLEELIKIVEPEATMPPVQGGKWPYHDCYMGPGWSLAYRTFDAQYWGVPQRRRRIYLVINFRSECAGQISFEREGVRGHFKTFKTAGERASGDAADCAGADDCEGRIVAHTFQNTGQGWWNESGVGTTLRTPCGGDATFANVVVQTVDGNILDDQGGQQITVRTDGKAPTLRAETHGNLPCVLEAAGFKAGNGAKARGIGWQEEVSPTLAAAPSGTNQAPTVCIKEQYLFENHSQDSRYKGPLDVCPMLPAQLGTGGNNQPFVVEQKPFRKGTRPHNKEEAQKWEDATVANTLNTFDVGETRANELIVEGHAYSLQGNTIDRNAKQNGNGICEDVAHTLNAVDRHGVCYCMATQQGGAEIMENLCPTITASAGMSGNNQPVVCMAHGQANAEILEDVCPCLNCNHEQPIVAGVDCRNLTEHPELYPTLQAKPNGGQSLNYSGAVRIEYIVRRLTPTECARLQGFPDNWGHPDLKDDFTDEEYRFWLDVRNTHAAINGKPRKDYTKGQILAWYNKLHTDSAEYKMWGNGISLPTALYVMQGIRDAAERDGM